MSILESLDFSSKISLVNSWSLNPRTVSISTSMKTLLLPPYSCIFFRFLGSSNPGPKHSSWGWHNHSVSCITWLLLLVHVDIFFLPKSKCTFSPTSFSPCYSMLSLNYFKFHSIFIPSLYQVFIRQCLCFETV